MSDLTKKQRQAYFGRTGADSSSADLVTSFDSDAWHLMTEAQSLDIWRAEQRTIGQEIGRRVAVLADQELEGLITVVLLKRHVSKAIPSDFSWRLEITQDDGLRVLFWPDTASDYDASSRSDPDYQLLAEMLTGVDWSQERARTRKIPPKPMKQVEELSAFEEERQAILERRRKEEADRNRAEQTPYEKSKAEQKALRAQQQRERLQVANGIHNGPPSSVPVLKLGASPTMHAFSARKEAKCL